MSIAVREVTEEDPLGHERLTIVTERGVAVAVDDPCVALAHDALVELAADTTEPRLVQAAGHGLLRLSAKRRGAVLKPTTAGEARFYELMESDEAFRPLRPFFPRHFATNELARPDPAHPTHSHEIEIENLCLLEGREKEHRSSDEDQTTDVDESIAASSYKGTPQTGMRGGGPSATSLAAASLDPHSTGNSHPGGEDPVSHGASYSSHQMLPSRRSEEGGSSFAEDSATASVSRNASPSGVSRTQWSSPSVLDVKVGRLRHGPLTPAAKVERIRKKDEGTTGPTLALRVCGIHHERRIVESELAGIARHASAEELANEVRVGDEVEDPLSRDDSAVPAGAEPNAESSSDEDDADVAQHATLRCYDTMQSRRREPARADKPHRGARRRRVVLGRRVEWVEGKTLGRTVDREGLVETLARFCTCVELRSVGHSEDGEAVAPERELQRGASGASLHDGTPARAGGSRSLFTPQPHIPLVRFYRDEAEALLRALDASRVLERYALVSSSVILVHDFHVAVPLQHGAFTGLAPHSANSVQSGIVAGTGGGRSFCVSCDAHGELKSPEELIRFRAQLRVVDFSSSGALSDGVVFPDSAVGFRDGLVNLIGMLDAVLDRYGHAAWV